MFKTREEVILWLMNNKGKELTSDTGRVRWGNGPEWIGGSAVMWVAATIDELPYRYRLPEEKIGPVILVNLFKEASECSYSGDKRLVCRVDENCKWELGFASCMTELSPFTRWAKWNKE
jgi:hypothetical protein